MRLIINIQKKTNFVTIVEIKNVCFKCGNEDSCLSKLYLDFYSSVIDKNKIFEILGCITNQVLTMGENCDAKYIFFCNLKVYV